MFRLLLLLAMVAPVAALAYPDVRLDKESCHVVHDRTQQQFVTQLPGCDVTFYNPSSPYWRDKVYRAVGQARRYGLSAKDVPAVPVAEDPNKPTCSVVRAQRTYFCWVFDRNSKLFLSRQAWYNHAKVCTVPNTDLFDVTYVISCWNNQEASPEEAECVRKIVSKENQLNTKCP